MIKILYETIVEEFFRIKTDLAHFIYFQKEKNIHYYIFLNLFYVKAIPGRMVE